MLLRFKFWNLFPATLMYWVMYSASLVVPLGRWKTMSVFIFWTLAAVVMDTGLKWPYLLFNSKWPVLISEIQRQTVLSEGNASSCTVNSPLWISRGDISIPEVIYHSSHTAEAISTIGLWRIYIPDKPSLLANSTILHQNWLKKMTVAPKLISDLYFLVEITTANVFRTT